ncbi:hypothetical protein [Variovorax saccharolyticus]|nr:hypothetical protein [Variovorax sp. J31P216]MDM0030060.1 hypothetical protein [Variovorax sp. J31P216]
MAEAYLLADLDRVDEIVMVDQIMMNLLLSEGVGRKGQGLTIATP